MYSFQSRVRYSEVDSKLCLTLPSIINYFQDCSTFQSEDLGVGVAFLKEHHRVWLVSAWQLQINRLPVLGELLTICTWPYDFKGMFGMRNFLLKDAQGEVLVAANSVWVHADTDTGRPTKLLPDYELCYHTEPPYDMTYASRKIALPEAAVFEDLSPIPVNPSHLDSNGHVNNGQYIAVASALVGADSFSGLRAEYKKSAVLGDTLYPRICRTDCSTYVLLCDSNQTPYVIVEYTT